MDSHSLSEKEQALICLAASVGSGCHPCTGYHLNAARAAGACERSISLAVETALTGRISAATAMGEWADQCQGSRVEVDPEFRASKRLMIELMSVATAVAANSVPDLEAHLAAARESSSTLDQIRAAVGIARQIQRVAQQKIEAIMNRLEGPGGSNSIEAVTTCCGTGQAPGPKTAVRSTASCACK